MTFLAFILASAAAPAPTATPAVSGNDGDVWAAAQRSGLAAAYEAYLRRFPQGLHAGAAAAKAAIPPIVAPPPAPPAPPAPPSPCTMLIVNRDVYGIASEEAAAFQAARRLNSLAGYRAFEARFPEGACRIDAEHIAAMRASFLPAATTIPRFGPLPAQRIGRFEVTEDDYPAVALRAEQQGRVTVAWEVAEDGIPESCRAIASSGSASLDEGSCLLVINRMRYDPARDAEGRAVRSIDRLTMTWAIPPEDPPPAKVTPGK